MSLQDGWFVNDRLEVFAIVAGSPVGEVNPEGTALAELGPGYYDEDLIPVPAGVATAPDSGTVLVPLSVFGRKA